jgi:hypothetical protein
MNVIDFTHLSSRNKAYAKQTVWVANGAAFSALNMPENEKHKATSVLYMHIHRKSRRCYVGITVMEANKRWFNKTAYRLNRRFGLALQKDGWDAFDSYILAFADDRDSLNQAEIAAIAAAGGHKSKYTYNLSPGGDTVSENDIPIVGINLQTGELRNFKSGADAARQLGFKNADNAMAVVRGEIAAASGWWFRLADDIQAQPPRIWGEKLRLARMRELNAKPIEAINYNTGECRLFQTAEDASRALEVQQSEVWAVAHGKAHSAGGWWFRFIGDTRPMPTLHGHMAARSKRDKRVHAVNLTTGERCVFRNCTIADKELGVYRGGSAAVAAGERVSANGWWFSHDENANPPTEFKGALVAKARSIAVVATNLATGEDRHFQSAKVAAEALGMSRSLICLAIKGKRKSAKGYKFSYA